MAITLCIDAAVGIACVGLVDSGQVKGQVLMEHRREHAERMFPTIEQLLSQAGYQLKQLDAIVVGLGPGSFIGARVAVASAKGLALGAGLPLIGVSTTAAVALSTEKYGRVAVALDAKKSQVYAAVYQTSADQLVEQELLTPSALDPEPCAQKFAELMPLQVLLGDGVTRYPQEFANFAHLPHSSPPPTALALYQLALKRLESGQFDDEAAVIPAYIRRSEAELKRAAKPS